MSETKLSCPFFKIENELKDKVKGYKYRYWNVSKLKLDIVEHLYGVKKSQFQ